MAVGGAMATRSQTIGYARRARMITRPDPSQAPTRGAIDAPIRLVIPKAANSSPNVGGEPEGSQREEGEHCHCGAVGEEPDVRRRR